MCYEEKKKYNVVDTIMISNILIMLLCSLVYYWDIEIANIMAWAMIIADVLYVIYDQVKDFKLINNFKK